jgi:hypothetical protein
MTELKQGQMILSHGIYYIHVEEGTVVALTGKDRGCIIKSDFSSSTNDGENLPSSLTLSNHFTKDEFTVGNLFRYSSSKGHYDVVVTENRKSSDRCFTGLVIRSLNSKQEVGTTSDIFDKDAFELISDLTHLSKGSLITCIEVKGGMLLEPYSYLDKKFSSLAKILDLDSGDIMFVYGCTLKPLDNIKFVFEPSKPRIVLKPGVTIKGKKSGKLWVITRVYFQENEVSVLSLDEGGRKSYFNLEEIDEYFEPITVVESK